MRTRSEPAREHARLRRLRRLFVLGHEPPDRQQHDNDDENDRPHREAAGGWRNRDVTFAAVAWALLAADSALRAAELAVELAAVAALETVDVAVWVRRSRRAKPPRPASSPEAPSALETSGGSAAEIALF